MIPLSFDEQKELLSERDEARRWARKMKANFEAAFRTALENRNLLCEAEGDISQLYAEINKVADWFEKKYPELIREGSACDNAVRVLDDWAEDKSYRAINRKLEAKNEEMRAENAQVEAMFNLIVEDIQSVKAENFRLIQRNAELRFEVERLKRSLPPPQTPYDGMKNESQEK